jgi:S1-C subfamily serine protease
LKFFTFVVAIAFFFVAPVMADEQVSLSTQFTTVSDKDPNKEKLEQLLYPVVRVTSGRGGGSGTVLYSEDREGIGEYQTFVMTNHHVIDNLIRVQKKWDSLLGKYIYVEDNDLAEVELFSYANGGKTVTRVPVKAEIIAWDADEDVALLKLLHPFKVEFTARILPKDRILSLFQEVYAVGCPDLVDPIFTKGEVTDLDFIDDKRSYVMTSADIIWGNSGGALPSPTWVDQLHRRESGSSSFIRSLIS